MVKCDENFDFKYYNDNNVHEFIDDPSYDKAAKIISDLMRCKDFMCDSTILSALYVAMRKLQGFSYNGVKMKTKMVKYRKKPVEIEAIEWDGDLEAISEFMGCEPVLDNPETFFTKGTICSIMINTPDGFMECNPYDYIIKGVAGEFYPCKSEIFKKTYERFGD